MFTTSNGYNPEVSRSYNNFRNASGPLDQHVPSSQYMPEMATPEFVVKMDNLVQSSVANFEQYIQVFHFDFNISRFTNPNTGNQQFSSSRVLFENPTLVIPNGVHAPNIVNRLIRGILVEEIIISRLQNINDVNQEAEAMTFTGCYFQNVQPKYDTLVIGFRFVEYLHKSTASDQKGAPKGNNVVGYSMGTGDTALVDAATSNPVMVGD